MEKTITLNCKNCGAALAINGKCEYCGTYHGYVPPMSVKTRYVYGWTDPCKVHISKFAQVLWPGINNWYREAYNT